VRVCRSKKALTVVNQAAGAGRCNIRWPSSNIDAAGQTEMMMASAEAMMSTIR